jgi:hypothetical protein
VASDLIERLSKREHFYRNAVEGEYDANLLMRARFALDEAAEALAAKDAEIARLTRNRDMWKGQCDRQAEQLTALRAQLAEQPGRELPEVDLEACAEAVFQANDTWDGADDHDERLALAVIRLVRPDYQG